MELLFEKGFFMVSYFFLDSYSHNFFVTILTYPNVVRGKIHLVLVGQSEKHILSSQLRHPTFKNKSSRTEHH